MLNPFGTTHVGCWALIHATLHAQGKIEEAKLHAARAIQIEGNSPGPAGPNLGYSLDTLAELLKTQVMPHLMPGQLRGVGGTRTYCGLAHVCCVCRHRHGIHHHRVTCKVGWLVSALLRDALATTVRCHFLWHVAGVFCL